MKQIIGAIGLSFVLTTSASAGAPVFPFATYAEAGKVMTSPPVQVCENGGRLVQLGDWRALSWNDRDLFIHFDAQGNPDWVYLTVDKGDGQIRVKKVLPADEARRLYPSGCEYGDERSA